MASQLATIAVTFDGSDVQDVDGIHLLVTAGVDDSPEVRGEDIVVPHNDGRVVRPRRFDRRRLLLEGFVRGVGTSRAEAMADYRANRRMLSTIFDNTAEPATLRLVLEDGDVARIEARPLSIEANEVVQSEFAYVSVELEAVSDWEGLGS